MGLTPKQYKALRFIIEFQSEKHGVSPSYEQIAAALGIKGKGGVNRLVNALEHRGFIRRIPHAARAIEVIRLPQTDRIKSLILSSRALANASKETGNKNLATRVLIDLEWLEQEWLN